MWIKVNDRRLFLTLMAVLIALSWLVLAIWSVSPYARYLDHGILHGLPHTLNGEYLMLLLIFVFGWTIMTTAMMLPTSLPLLALFHRLTRQRHDQRRLIAWVIVGYLGIWALFGGVAHIGDLLVHQIVEQSAWLHTNAWLLSATTLALAGLYQFTPLKYACLDKCRSPLSFITEHWRGHHEQMHAFRLGVHHGIFCIGCCWLLMLLMFVVGMGNIAWMLALGAVMAAEKNLSSGRKLSAPLGLVLLGCSMTIILTAVAGT